MCVKTSTLISVVFHLNLQYSRKHNEFNKENKEKYKETSQDALS